MEKQILVNFLLKYQFWKSLMSRKNVLEFCLSFEQQTAVEKEDGFRSNLLVEHISRSL